MCYNLRNNQKEPTEIVPSNKSTFTVESTIIDDIFRYQCYLAVVIFPTKSESEFGLGISGFFFSGDCGVCLLYTLSLHDDLSV